VEHCCSFCAALAEGAGSTAKGPHRNSNFGLKLCRPSISAQPIEDMRIGIIEDIRDPAEASYPVEKVGFLLLIDCRRIELEVRQHIWNRIKSGKVAMNVVGGPMTEHWLMQRPDVSIQLATQMEELLKLALR
jgi:hypothetical protein